MCEMLLDIDDLGIRSLVQCILLPHDFKKFNLGEMRRNEYYSIKEMYRDLV